MSIDPADSTDESDDLVEFNSAPFLLLASKYYQKSSIWFMLVSAFCAFRSASAFTVSVAYIQVFSRLIQVIALMLKKRPLAKVSYGLATVAIIMMFFADMID